MSWTDNLAQTMGTLVVWGFLMAALFNIFLRVISVKKDNYLVFICVCMFSSYYFSDLFHDLSAGAEIYFTWFCYDIATLIVVLVPIVQSKIRENLGAAPYYIILGLVINAILFISMYIDIQLLSNTEHWILWDIYMFTVNVVDYFMIITLIVGKDWLGLVRIGRFIKARLLAKKQALSEKKKCVESEIKQKRLAHSIIEA